MCVARETSCPGATGALAMPSFSHEGCVRLFYNRPELAVELLRDVLGVRVPAYTEARVDTADLSDLEPAARTPISA